MKFLKALLLWWSLDNVGLLGNAVFGIAGAIAALAAVNFFYFAPQIPQPLVARTAYIDDGKITMMSDDPAFGTVSAIAAALQPDALRDLTHSYDAGKSLTDDCAQYRQEVDQLDASACDSLGLTSFDYPEYLHRLVASGESLGPEQLDDAYKALRVAAVPVDAVTVTNKGGVDASNIQLTIPAGLQGVDLEKDKVPLSITTKHRTVILLFRNAPSTAPDEGPPSPEGFDVASSTGDTVFDQQLALHLIIGAGIFLVAVLLLDMWRTRDYPGRRSER